MREYFIAFFAGSATFISPCVLPLIPGYLSMVSGVSSADILKEEGKGLHGKVFWYSLFFFLGFSFVFSVMGASASFLGKILFSNKLLLTKIMGFLLFILGFHMTGIFNIKALNYEKRAILRFENKNYFSAFLIGAAFAFGWSPCIGPILAGMLTMAAGTAVYKGALLLFVFSLGLGLPFLLAGLLSATFFKFLAKYKTAFKYVEIVSGAVLMILGVLLFLNKFSIE